MSGKYLSLLVHFTWSTKGRQPYLKTDMRDDLYSYIGGIMKNKRAKLIAAGGMPDHIHLCASMPSTITIADFVNAVKANSSRGFITQTICFGVSPGRRDTAPSA